MDTSRYAELFLSESREHISSINRLLLALEADERDSGSVEELFRAVHTIKGMSAAMGCRTAADLSHALEHLLDHLRRGALGVDAEVMDALFEGVDALERAIETEGAGREGGEAAGLIGRLSALAEGPEPASTASAPAVGERAEEAAGPEGGRALRVTVLIQASASLPSVRAMLVLKRARELGSVRNVEPGEEQLQAGQFSGSLSFVLHTAHESDEVRAGLLAAGDVAHVVLEEAPQAAPGGGGADARDPERERGREAFVRIRQARLDALLDQIGELVIARDRLLRVAAAREDPELGEATERLSRLVAHARDEVMHIRMVGVGEVFERFPRLVRDAARSLGKQVSFATAGREVQLDRSLANELGDLLVHLLRNAVDHGIEPPQERVAAGKPETGELRLRAVREGSQVLVRVEDDGRGVERKRVADVAVARGLLSRKRVRKLSDGELLQLITRPGFSTAERVTEVSGRGVGLDVVRTRVHALGGALEVESEPGRGTAFTLRLPLSLTILRALQVRIGPDVFAIPVSAVLEVAEVPVGRARSVVVRDERVPLARLPALFGARERGRGRGAAPVVVVSGEGGRLALEVDELLDQQEAVLKPFDPVAGMLPVFSGATLLSDGRPCLIIDVRRLSAWLAEQRGRNGAPSRELEPTTTG